MNAFPAPGYDEFRTKAIEIMVGDDVQRVDDRPDPERMRRLIESFIGSSRR